LQFIKPALVWITGDLTGGFAWFLSSSFNLFCRQFLRVKDPSSNMNMIDSILDTEQGFSVGFCWDQVSIQSTEGKKMCSKLIFGSIANWKASETLIPKWDQKVIEGKTELI
jgi:hypothetical protein